MISLLNSNGEGTEDETTVTTSDAPRKIPADLTLLPFKEYSMLFRLCVYNEMFVMPI